MRRCPRYGSQLGEGLRELGRSQGDIKAIALTHAHADHVGFAEQLRRKLDIPVYVHRGDAELAGNLRRSGARPARWRRISAIRPA